MNVNFDDFIQDCYTIDDIYEEKDILKWKKQYLTKDGYNQYIFKDEWNNKYDITELE